MSQERRTTSGKSPKETMSMVDFIAKEVTAQTGAERRATLTKVSALNCRIIEVNDFGMDVERQE